MLQNLMAICPSLTNIMTTKKLRSRHLNALGMVGNNSQIACLLELPGAPGGVQGDLTGMHLKCWHYQNHGLKVINRWGQGVAGLMNLTPLLTLWVVLMTTCAGGGGAVGLGMFCFQWWSYWICFSCMYIFYQAAIKHLFILSYLIKIKWRQ